ncbi:MAG: type II restriction endonuclease [Oscillospiraceae bacterium]|jgi:type II restriction enzyme|nr:type II restriction endonuclease [Oscillospiraceae bacterium]
MDNIAASAIQAANNGQMAYCKFLSANDTGDTGAHQAGIYIAKSAIAILFDEAGRKGENTDRFVKIWWQDSFETDSRFIYYGTGTRNEYRITRFGRDFPYLRPEHTGDLFVLVRYNSETYEGFILETEEDINAFLDAFALSPTDTGTLIQTENMPLETRLELAFADFIQSLANVFPASACMSGKARDIYHDIYDHKENILHKPDDQLIHWMDTEYRLFRKLEFKHYGSTIAAGFRSIDQFIEMANMVLNRRKSRAGKSLEHHLAAIFDGNGLAYQAQPRTEGSKRPDFLFPGEQAYHDAQYPSERLIFLGAKTTCKDRWRQVINEADRIRDKHLFTLQQGMSAQQLVEMEAARITLVVPEPYITTYPKEKRGDIWTLKKFIAYAKERAAF